MNDLPGDSYWAWEGEVLAGPYPGALDARQARQKLAVLLDAGVTAVVDLTEEGEHDLVPYAPLLREVAAERDTAATYTRISIEDVNVPSRWLMRGILDVFAAATDAEQVVYVHCWGGVGRTGTVVGCLLREHGAPRPDVLGHIATEREHTARAHRESPETEAQRDFVLDWPGVEDDD